jgi:hypothetical protein
MLMGVRIYAEEQHARDAAAALMDAGLSARAVNVLVPEPGRESEIVQAAIEDRRLPGSHVHAATEALRKGQTVLAVDLPYESRATMAIMERYGPVETAKLPSPSQRNPAPLSSLLGLPVLTESRGQTTVVRGSNRHIMDFFPLLTEPKSKKSSFGIPLLSKPTAKRDKSFGFPMLSKPTARKEKSFGFPLLIRDKAAPLSSLFGLKLLTKSHEERRR